MGDKPTISDIRRWHKDLEPGLPDWFDLAGILLDELEAADEQIFELGKDLVERNCDFSAERRVSHSFQEGIKAAEADNKELENALSVAVLAKQSAEQQASLTHQKTYKEALLQNTETGARLEAAEAKLEAYVPVEAVIDKIRYAIGHTVTDAYVAELLELFDSDSGNIKEQSK